VLLTAYLLALLAILLAWPVPVALSRAQWTSRSPFAAMVLWQSIALAGGLSMIGAMLVYGLEPLGDNLLQALRRAIAIVLGNRATDELHFWHLFALCAAALLGTHLIFTLGLTYARITTQRRRHRELLEVLSSPSGAIERTLVINHPAPVAYCLPGGSRSVTVLSDGLLEALSPAELAAVVDHERAHLTQRHHLLLWAFEAWRQALPWLPTTRLSRAAVSSLVEMLADDIARRTTPDETLVRAIALVALGGGAAEPPQGLPAVVGPQPTIEPGMPDEGEASLAARVSRLLTPRPPLSRARTTAVLAGSGLLLAVPTALLLAPGLVG
jgi:Zn-dependent protease with chaperone function